MFTEDDEYSEGEGQQSEEERGEQSEEERSEGEPSEEENDGGEDGEDNDELGDSDEVRAQPVRAPPYATWKLPPRRCLEPATPTSTCCTRPPGARTQAPSRVPFASSSGALRPPRARSGKRSYSTATSTASPPSGAPSAFAATRAQPPGRPSARGAPETPAHVRGSQRPAARGA